MFNKFIIFCTAILLQSCLLFSADGQSRGSIKWYTNYEEALKQARSASQPVLLFFTGSDWCSWCNKIDEEVFNTKEFADGVGNKFVFVKLDMPLYSAQDPQIKAQNKQLQQKFEVRSFPSVIIYDAQQNQQIGVTGYRAGGGKQYASHLSKMLSDYAAYKQKMGSLDKSKPSGSDLKQLHEKAKELAINSDITKIVKMGMDSEQSQYFQLERYRFLANEGQIHSQEAGALRQQLLAADPTNDRQMHYQVAIVDFEAACDHQDHENYNARASVAPLVAYIDKFGEKDRDNLWRLEMIISQVYLDNSQLPEALKYAQRSYETAPASAQPEIAVAIRNIKSLISSVPSSS